MHGALETSFLKSCHSYLCHRTMLVLKYFRETIEALTHSLYPPSTTNAGGGKRVFPAKHRVLQKNSCGNPDYTLKAEI